jgi:hypothetical protein
MMIRRPAVFVALLAATAALAVPALAGAASTAAKVPPASTEAKVTVGSPSTPYLPYLHPSVTASVRFRGFTVMVTLAWGCLSLLPVP